MRNTIPTYTHALGSWRFCSRATDATLPISQARRSNHHNVTWCGCSRSVVATASRTRNAYATHAPTHRTIPVLPTGPHSNLLQPADAPSTATCAASWYFSTIRSTLDTLFL